jgi:hypothetical protein
MTEKFTRWASGGFTVIITKQSANPKSIMFVGEGEGIGVGGFG